MKISVIMASWLGAKRSHLDKKFIRAVNSFLKQTHEDKELIIISDGCQITNKLYDEHFRSNPLVTLFSSNKLPPYSGGIRDIGLKLAKGEIISYLDSDDVIGKNHLKIIHDQMEDYDWVFYDDFMVLDKTFKKFQKRYVDPRWGKIGTSSISHINFEKIPKYEGKLEWFDGYGHDFIFMMKLASMGTKFKKLKETPQYFVCHYHNFDG